MTRTPRILRWPAPYRWAYAMTDDTDESTLESTRVVYEYCLERGIKPTRLLWTHEPSEKCGVVNPEDPIPGASLEDPAYRDYCRDLHARGVTFGLHGASAGNSTRERTLAGFERFEQVFGQPADLFIAHMRNAENIYWGAQRYTSPLLRAAARSLIIPATYHGEDESSPYYWADICRERVSYIRLYRTRTLNVLAKNPSMPFHDPRFPAVRHWYSASGQNLELLDRLTQARLDRVAREDGLILHYTHASWFVDDPAAESPKLLEPARRGFDHIGARSDVWCAGVSDVLDRLLHINNLAVTHRHHATIIANPLDAEITSVQLDSGGATLYRPDASPLAPDARGIITVERIPAAATITLYRDPARAELKDTTACPPPEQRRMMLEEARRLVWQKLQRLRGRDP